MKMQDTMIDCSKHEANVIQLENMIDDALTSILSDKKINQFMHKDGNIEQNNDSEANCKNDLLYTYLEPTLEYLTRSKKTLINAKKKLIQANSTIEKIDIIEDKADRDTNQKNTKILVLDSVSDQLDAMLIYYKAYKNLLITSMGYKSNGKKIHLIVFIQLLYLFIFIAGLLLYHYYKKYSLTDIEVGMRTNYLFNVPIFVFVWGFIGGICWCLYSLTFWVRRRMFNQDYLLWYCINPIVSCLIGSVTTLVILGGLTTFSQPGSSEQNAQLNVPQINYQLAAILSIISFLGGFSTHRFWTVLDSTVAGILKIDIEGTIINKRNIK